MTRIFIEDTIEKVEESVEIQGYIETIRLHGKIAFLDVRDMTGIMQVVVIQSQTPEAFETVQKLRPQFVVEIEGLIHKRNERNINPNSKTGSVKL